MSERRTNGVENAASAQNVADEPGTPERALGARVRDRLVYALLRGWTELSGLLPPRAGAAAGVAIGEFVYRVLRIRRRVVQANLRSTLGLTLDRAGCEQIARGVYHHLGRSLYEYGQIRRLDRQQFEAWVEVVGFDSIRSAIARGRGVILTAGHLGNWELAGMPITAHGFRLSLVAKRQRNPHIDRYLAGTRKLSAELLYLGPEVRQIFRRLRAGEVIGMLIDQDAGPAGEFMDVMGRVASVQPGAGVFAQRTGAAIVPCAVRRLPNGRQRVTYEPAILPDLEQPAAAEIERLNRLATTAIERHVWRAPEQYYWVHRRWKSRPEQKGSLPQSGAFTRGQLHTNSYGARPL